MEDYSEPLDLSLPSVKMKNTNHNASETDLPLDLSRKRIDNPQTIQTGPFTNSIIKNIPNFNKTSKMHQGCGSSGITYKPRNAHTCIPVRNNYSDTYEDEQESEEPFDFSCRYSETKSSSNQKNNYKRKKSKSSNGNYSIYAETDLDQPTDYSLRYAENDSDTDSEVCDNEEKTTAAEFVGDTVKTYCTEGTPYETPFNFSTSTSMSDLRMSEKITVDCIGIPGDKMKIDQNMSGSKINDKIPEEAISVSDDQPQTPKLKSEFNSGLTSPEKPMNYCEEGTPGYFSRVSSFGSLNSAAAGSGEEKLSEDKNKGQVDTPKGDKMQQKMPNGEGKVVKFENIVNYCEETPLMFSRSSSLGSLDSIEQSMPDDRSSVISDFSRLTSGIISPSEIPDSPTQTVPPSPKQRKSSDFGMMNRTSSVDSRRHSSARRSLPTKSSIFEDDVTKFKEESTPAQFSVATSLSSLTIDDHDEGQMQEGPDQNCSNRSRTHEEEEHAKDGSLHDKTDGPSFRNTRDNMQNRCFQLASTGQFQPNYQDSTSPVYKPNTSTFSSRALPPPLSQENSICAYNTEDTPAVLSHNGSISELSALSMLDEEPVANRVYLSENSSQFSGGRGNDSDKEKQQEASEGRRQMGDIWVRRESTVKQDSNPYQGDDSLPPYLASKDEYCQFAVEDSPAQFSLRSSLSHLTMDSERASGILDFSFTSPKEAPESQEVEGASPEKASEPSVDGAEIKPDVSVTAGSDPSIKNEETEEVASNAEIPGDVCANEDENTKSFEMKSDDSRYNSMKKRKWKWKWQFGSEDGQSESGDSTQTDKHSSNNEEFDQGRRGRFDKNNAGNLDASFKKKKWWKWKFTSKEKDSSVAAPVNSQEPVYDCVVDEEQIQKSNSVEEKELDTRNKSKRWKWKWKLNFKDDDNGKSDKPLLGLSKLKQQVCPKAAKEPLCVNDVMQSEEYSKETNSIVKFLPEHSKSESTSTNENISLEENAIKYRGKLDTPEPSDSEQSVIFEEVDEHNSSEVRQTSIDRNLTNGVHESDDGNVNKSDNLVESSTPSNFAALVEECIQLGMPKKKNIPTDSHNNSQESRSSSRMTSPKNDSDFNKEQCNVLSKIIAEDRMAALKECIQLGTKSSSNVPRVDENVQCSKPGYPQAGGLSSKAAGRISTANFDSASLNRFSLGKSRRNDFNSNDNILRDIPNESSGKQTQSYVRRSVRDEDRRNDGISKTGSNKTKESGEVMEFVNGKMAKLEISSSQSDRSVLKTQGSKSGQFLRETRPQVVPKVASVQNETAMCDPVKNPDFAAIIEECIQLGMPKRKETSQETLSPTLSPSVARQKPISLNRWPEYLSKISCENNKSASLPKASSHLTASRGYCASNEDFTKADLPKIRDLAIQSTLAKNVKCKTLTNNTLKSDREKKQERIVYVSPKTGFDAGKKDLDRFDDRISQGETDYEESLYANVNETRSCLNQAVREQPSYSYKSISPERTDKPHSDLPPKRGLNDKENSPLVEDCIKLGIPVKKLQDLRRSLDRSSSQEMLKKSKYESFEGNVRTTESEDEAVYANTTERYTIFRNSMSPKIGNKHENTLFPILPDKKIPPYDKKNLGNDSKKLNSSKNEFPSESQGSQDFAAIIEECIQLGMPKRKEFSRETLNSNLSLSSTNSRSNSTTGCMDYLPKVPFESSRSVTLPKGATYFPRLQNQYSSNEDFSRSGSQRKKTPLVQGKAVLNDANRALKSSPQIGCSRLLSTKNNNSSPTTQPAERVGKTNKDQREHMKSEETPAEEELEESLYVNVSKHAGYSRSTNRQPSPMDVINFPPEVTKPHNATNPNGIDTSHSEPRFSALIEECIKLGMPSKKISDIQKYLKNVAPQITDQKLRASNISDQEDRTSDRYSPFRSSRSESGFNRSPRISVPSNFKRGPSSVHGGDLEIKKPIVITPSSTIEKALEECIQLGWPKKKDLDKNPPPKYSASPPTDTFMRKSEKPVSKNVNVASVVRNMQKQRLARSKVPASATGAKDDSEHPDASKRDAEEAAVGKEKNGFDDAHVICSKMEKSGFDEGNRADSEMSFAGLEDVDSKLLDPQAVLESLEKYTAKLISEAESRLSSKKSGKIDYI